MKKRLILLYLLGLTLMSLNAIAQDESEMLTDRPANLFIRGDFEYGLILVGENDLPSDINRVMGGNIEVGWQTAGKSVYDNVLGYPTFGFGFLTYGFPQTGILGEPNAFYMFLNAPFHRWDRFSLMYILRLGMSYNWEPSDPVANPGHLALGSFRNLYIAGGLEGQFLLGERSTIGVGLKFTHFSNGQSSLPNAGMNLLTPHIAYKYDLNGGDRPAYKKYKTPAYNDKGMEYYFTIGNGVRQIFFDSAQTGVSPRTGVSYPVVNLSLGAQYHYNWAGKFGGGVDLIYWGAYDPGFELSPGGIVKRKSHPFGDYLQVGIFGSYEFALSNFSIYLQPGYRIIRKEYQNMPPDFYQHLGLKYHINDLILGVAIRAVNFGQAEYIEWNIGYRFRNNHKK